MILDSSFVIDLLGGDDDAVEKLTELVLRGSPLRVSTLTVTEVEIGLHQSKADQFETVMRKLDPIAFDIDAAHTAATIQRDLRARGEQIGAVDAMIAATALEGDGIVVTRNTDEFERVDDLDVEPY